MLANCRWDLIRRLKIKQQFEDNDYNTKLNAAELRILKAFGIVSRNVLKYKKRKITVQLYRR